MCARDAGSAAAAASQWARGSSSMGRCHFPAGSLRDAARFRRTLPEAPGLCPRCLMWECASRRRTLRASSRHRRHGFTGRYNWPGLDWAAIAEPLCSADVTGINCEVCFRAFIRVTHRILELRFLSAAANVIALSGDKGVHGGAAGVQAVADLLFSRY